MISPSERSYKETKQIKLGKREMSPDFIGLAQWINRRYKVEVLNIAYDLLPPDRRPRIDVIFEFYNGLRMLNGVITRNNEIQEIQQDIVRKFDELVNDKPLGAGRGGTYEVKDMFAIFSSFASVAVAEAYINFKRSGLSKLKEELNCPDLWDISDDEGRVTFFLYTDQQKERYQNSEDRKIWTDRVFALLDNPFGYIKRNEFAIVVESKEFLDKHFSGSLRWYHHG